LLLGVFAGESLFLYAKSMGYWFGGVKMDMILLKEDTTNPAFQCNPTPIRELA
jgi:hypothetical protein